jgi:hypothetical protein
MDDEDECDSEEDTLDDGDDSDDDDEDGMFAMVQVLFLHLVQMADPLTS